MSLHYTAAPATAPDVLPLRLFANGTAECVRSLADAVCTLAAAMGYSLPAGWAMEQIFTMNGHEIDRRHCLEINEDGSYALTTNGMLTQARIDATVRIRAAESLLAGRRSFQTKPTVILSRVESNGATGLLQPNPSSANAAVRSALAEVIDAAHATNSAAIDMGAFVILKADSDPAASQLLASIPSDNERQHLDSGHMPFEQPVHLAQRLEDVRPVPVNTNI